MPKRPEPPKTQTPRDPNPMLTTILFRLVIALNAERGGGPLPVRMLFAPDGRLLDLRLDDASTGP